MLALSLTGASQAQSTPAPDATVSTADLPRDGNALFWTTPQRDAAFRAMEQILPFHTVRAGRNFHILPDGARIDPHWNADGRDWDLASYMADQRLAGIIVLHHGRVVLEQYGLGFGREGRWTSFSVAKSFTSTLVGAALRDGAISSLDDPVTRYIPELAGSGYDGVSVRQLLTMTSGVRWNEDYTSPTSDVARFFFQQPEGNLDPVTAYMRHLPREVAPGTRWHYNTGETNLIGVLVERATGKTLAEYLSAKVWIPYGMGGDAYWTLNSGGHEVSGCCLSMTLRDYARFGQFVLDDGVAGGYRVVPEGWFDAAGHKQADIGRPGFGYGYQWWTMDDGAFAAQGIFGQGIFIDRARGLVIAGVGNYEHATDPVMARRRQAFYMAVRAAIDAAN
ncbi:MAG: serine hydrolase [Sphingomonadaceae bacterium]|nr:serine hydrolase [Sphingomonadaceae bacterium]